jgi:phage shock protein C
MNEEQFETQKGPTDEGPSHRHSWQGRQLYRSRTNRMLAGVCGGLGELTGIDANLMRLAWIFLFFFGGAGLWIYLIMAIVIPEQPEGDAAPPISYADHWQSVSRNGALAIGIVVIVVGLALLLSTLGWLPVSLGYLWRLFWRLFWPLVLIGLGLMVLLGAFWGDQGWWRNVRMPERGSILSRSRNNRMVAGVCGGIAEYFNLDPSLLRIIWAIGTLSTMGTGILAYIVAAIVLPEKPADAP